MQIQRTGARAAVAAWLALAGAAASAAVPLPQLNIEPGSITVSGLSAGGFMANQLGWAFSGTFKGVGVFAGGPYMCAGHSNYTACMYNATIGAQKLATMQGSLNAWSGTLIDDRANAAAQKVYLFVGTSDFTVGPNPMNAVQQQYRDNGVPATSLQYVQRSGTAHVFPTDFAASGNNACNSSASPYIANCGYDGAKAVLSMFYGTLAPRNDAPAAGNYLEFDQAAFTANPGMAATGWLYVPAACAAGTACRLHVALHGCKQDTASIGTAFVKNTGYTRWADTNRIVVLFPQAKVDNVSRNTAASGSLANPNACWDWVGWYGNGFAQRGGTQVAAIKAMVDRVASGTGGGGGGNALPAPTGVAASNPTSTSMTVSWNAVTGAAGYNVFRSGTKLNATPLSTTSTADTGLSPATTYSWAVAAVDAAGVQGTLSASASGTTTGTAPTCFSASNYAHTTAGRATVRAGVTYANGSNQNMGLWNVFINTTLKQTGPNYYVIGSC